MKKLFFIALFGLLSTLSNAQLFTAADMLTFNCADTLCITPFAGQYGFAYYTTQDALGYHIYTYIKYEGPNGDDISLLNFDTQQGKLYGFELYTPYKDQYAMFKNAFVSIGFKLDEQKDGMTGRVSTYSSAKYPRYTLRMLISNTNNHYSIKLLYPFK